MRVRDIVMIAILGLIGVVVLLNLRKENAGPNLSLAGQATVEQGRKAEWRREHGLDKLNLPAKTDRAVIHL